MSGMSPDNDARLLPWIDATVPLSGGGTVDTPSRLDGASSQERTRASRVPTAQQLYDIRLPDGSHVQMTATELCEFEHDWHVNLTIEQSETLYKVIMEDE